MRVVFLPGMSGHGSFWAPVVERLPSVEAVFVDWPGLGDNPARPDVQGYDDLERVVWEAAGSAGPVVLVGQSMGGYVALRCALDRPSQVSHLVLAATSGGLDLASLGATDWRPGSRAAHPAAPDWAFVATADLSDRLPTVDVPALLVWATDDAISPLAVGERLAGLLPRSELLVLDDDDHWVAARHPEEVAAAIAAFVGLGPGVS